MRRWDRIFVSLLPLFILFAHETQGRVILCDETLGKEITSTYEERYPFYGKIFSSVAYFNFRSLRILYEVDFVMNGLLSLYSRDDLPGPNENITADDSTHLFDPESEEEKYHPFPKLMLADLQTETFEQATLAAQNAEVDFVILAIDEASYTWKEMFQWWWTRRIPRIDPNKYISTSRTEPPYYLAISSLDGKYLKEILWEKRNSILDYGDLSNPSVQVEIDDTSVMEGMAVIIQAALYIVFMCIALRWLCKPEILQETFTPARKPKFTVEDLGQGVICEGPSSHECAICLETIPIGTTVRILPCRHSFHHECIIGWMNEDKYTCPMCKFDLSQHFEEQKAAKETMQLPKASWKHRVLQKTKEWGIFRNIETDNNHLLEGAGDLELTEEQIPAATQPPLRADIPNDSALPTVAPGVTRTICVEDGVTV